MAEKKNSGSGLLAAATNWGVSEKQSSIENRRTIVCNQLAFTAYLVPMPFFILNISEAFTPLFFIGFWISVTLVLFLNRAGWIRTARALFVLSITNVFYWLGVMMDSKWPELKGGFLVDQIAFYSFPLILFSLKTDRWLILAFMLIGAVQLALFYPLDASIDLLFSKIPYEAEAAQTNLQYAVGLLVLTLSFGFYQRIARQAEEKAGALLAETQEQNRMLQTQEEEIRQAADELQSTNDQLNDTLKQVQEQRNELGRKNEDILESINYARRIQTAILPPSHLLETHLKDHFVFYRPRDIVSGDFYWLHAGQDRIYVAVVDCTGHGVPGAFMSVLAYSLLNQVVQELPEAGPDQVIAEMDSRVRISLRQQDRNSGHDGMDLALCVLNARTGVLEFAGAGRPLLVLRNGELMEWSGDKLPVGGAQHESKLFTKHDVALQNGDRLFLYTDGITDQFGVDQGRRRKFSPRRLKEWLVERHDMPMGSMGVSFEALMDNWMGQEEQIDDFSLLAFEWRSA